MKTSTVTPADLQASVLAVPPLARNADLSLNFVQNRRLAGHLEAAGVTTLMYGGNANFHNIGTSDFAQTLEHLVGVASPTSWVIPSIGPDFGKAMDQAAIAAHHDFPAVMVLPMAFPATPSGVARGLARITEVLRKPIVVYLKSAHYITASDLAALNRDGVVAALKYAVVRDDPAEDAYLGELVDTMGPERIISGIGERPVIAHVQRFGLRAFTSGSVCVAPHLSNAIREALARGDASTARSLREHFLPLEDLRDAISPIRVLHCAVTQAGIADMGPMLPMLSELEDQAQIRDVALAATRLFRADGEHRLAAGGAAPEADAAAGHHTDNDHDTTARSA